jgi:hypothetical protein
MPVAGSISHLVVRISRPPGGDKSWAFMLLNSAAVQEGETGVGCTISGAETSCVSPSAVAILGAGDLLSLKIDPIHGPPDTEFINWTVAFTAK